METIKVLLVDDEARVRQGLAMRLALEPDIAVVGEAADGSEAVGLARELQPDVVLMDVQMADVNGLSATHELHEAAPNATVVILSFHDDSRTRLMARVAGAAGFVSKAQMDSTLLETIREAARSGAA